MESDDTTPNEPENDPYALPPAPVDDSEPEAKKPLEELEAGRTSPPLEPPDILSGSDLLEAGPILSLSPIRDQREMRHSLTAERAAIACVFYQPETWEIVGRLTAQDFYSEPLRRTFAAMRTLHGSGGGYGDLVSVKDYLEDTGELEAVGGTAYLAGLLQGVAKSANAKYYVHRIRALSRRRSVAKHAEILSRAAMTTTSPEELTRLAERLPEILHVDDDISLHNSIDIGTVFDTPIESPPWAIPGFCCNGETVILGGEWGAGKSMIALDLAMALARDHESGSPEWCGLEIDRGPGDGAHRVLYVDEENPEHLVRSRMQRLARGRAYEESELPKLGKSLRYLNRCRFNLSDPSSFQRLRSECNEFNPDWIILDSLRRFHTNKENDNDEMAAFYASKIDVLQRDFNTGLIVLHHMSKPTGKASEQVDAGHRIRGAGDLAGAFNNVWTLTKDEERFTLRNEKGRWGTAGIEVVVTIEDQLDGAALMVTGQSATREADSIAWRMLSDAGPSGVLRGDIVDVVRQHIPEAKGARSVGRTVSRQLGRYVAQGKAIKQRDGRSMRYWLTACAPRGLVDISVEAATDRPVQTSAYDDQE